MAESGPVRIEPDDIRILPLQEKHVEDAARLAASRFRDLRLQIPLLPPRYERWEVVADMLNGLEGGAAAFQDHKLVGFLTGYVLPSYIGKRAFYSPEWANAAEPAHSRRIYHDLYAWSSPRWVEQGCQLHALSLTSDDREAVEAWGWLGFGMVAVDGLRGLETIGPGPSEVEIRLAGEVEDVFALGKLLESLSRYMAGPPIFFPHEIDDPEALLAKPGYQIWLAFEKGEAVGCLGMDPAYSEGCVILQDDKTIQVEPAFIEQPSRGRGIGAALLNHGLEWARREGYARCSVDYELANLQACRFWGRYFDPVCYSLVRTIDERVFTT